MENNTDKNKDWKEKQREEIKKQEEQAKEIHGTVNYAFIQLDQPRGWKGFIAKGLVNGAITTTCVITGLAIRDHVKARKEGKLLSLDKSAEHTTHAPHLKRVQ